MTDPWTTPDPWQAPGGWVAPGDGPEAGWGSPPGPPDPPGRAWRVSLVVVVAVAVAAAVGAIAVRPASRRADPDARPAPSHAATRAPTRTPRARPATPRATPPPVAPSPPAVPVATYSAPPDGVPVRGRVVDAAGRPVAAAAVSLTQEQDALTAFATTFAALATLGLACLSDICTVPYGEGRTAADGSFTVYLPKTKGDYHLVVGRRDGPIVTATVRYTARPVRLPDVVVWDPAPAIERQGHEARVRFRSPPARLGSWTGASAVITDGKQRELLALYSVQSGDAFDGRLIEDTARRLEVAVRVRTALGPTAYTARVAVRGGPRPVSRGKPCHEYGRAGRPIANRPCGLTDGELQSYWTPKVPDYQCANDSPCPRRVSVDLGSARRISFVAVHGCDSFFDQVESSVDGATWEVLIAEDSPEVEHRDMCYAAVDTVARYVRVKGPAGGFYSSRKEISVF